MSYSLRVPCSCSICAGRPRLRETIIFHLQTEQSCGTEEYIRQNRRKKCCECPKDIPGGAWISKSSYYEHQKLYVNDTHTGNERADGGEVVDGVQAPWSGYLPEDHTYHSDVHSDNPISSGDEDEQQSLFLDQFNLDSGFGERYTCPDRFEEEEGESMDEDPLDLTDESENFSQGIQLLSRSVHLLIIHR